MSNIKQFKFKIWLPDFQQWIYPHICDFIRRSDGMVIGQIIPFFKYGVGLAFHANFVHSQFQKDQLGLVNEHLDDIMYEVHPIDEGSYNE